MRAGERAIREPAAAYDRIGIGYHETRRPDPRIAADLARHRPELYLDPAVRRGISSFALLADAGEVEAGLARLAADLASGRLAEIRARVTSPRGDYVFVVAEAGSPP